MEKQNKYLDDLLICGYVDNRRLAGVANAKRLPNGEFGLCLMCLNRDFLYIYDTDFSQQPGALLYTVDLTKITDLKISTFVLNSYVRFTYEGFKYKLADCARKDIFLAIKQQSDKTN